jgi:hypothetical protein
MYPRSEEDAAAAMRIGKIPGFVSFMSRAHAENALNALDGVTLGGHVLRLGWGKILSIPSEPVFGEYLV